MPIDADNDIFHSELSGPANGVEEDDNASLFDNMSMYFINEARETIALRDGLSLRTLDIGVRLLRLSYSLLISMSLKKSKLIRRNTTE